MKKIILTIVILALVFIANAQTYQGTVKDTNGEPVPFANVVLYSLPDSTFVEGTTTNDIGEFLLETKTKKEGYLEISFIGYQTQIVAARENIKTITLQEMANELGEVVVKARRPIVRQEAGKLIVGISGSSLSEAGNLMDILQKTPGLQVKEGAISVFGKGAPIIFINGREIRNNAEFESLQSDDIATIEIDRNPSARYSASGNAVVRITTKKITKDRMNIQLYNRAYFARKFSNVGGLQLNSKWNRTQFSVNYSYTHSQAKNYDDAYEINSQPNYTIKNKNYAKIEPTAKKHNLFASLSQQLGKKHTLGGQFSYINTKRDDLTTGNQTITKSNTPTTERLVVNNSKNKYYLTVYSLNYEFKIDSINTLQIVGDYTHSTSDGDDNITEENLTTATTQKSNIANTNDYDVYSAKVDYETVFSGKLPFRAGVKLSEVKNDGGTTATNILQQMQKYKTSNATNDRIKAAYVLISPTFGKWNMEAGVRYEHTDRNVSATGTTVLDTTYGKWFPTVNVNRVFLDNLNINLSYAKKIHRPAFWELNSNRNYIDSLSYSMGNPKLKAAISHNIDLNIGLFKHLFLSFNYEYEQQARIQSAISDTENPDIVVYTPVNIDKAEYLRASANYDWSYKFWKNTLSFGVEQPFMEIPYLGKTKKIDRLSYYFQTNNDFRLSDKFTLFCNFSYYSASEDLMSYYYDNYNLSAGLNASFLDKKLKISLLVNDILDASETAWKDQYGNVESYSNQDKDRTYLRLSVKYNINSYKGGIRKKTAGEDELNRM